MLMDASLAVTASRRHYLPPASSLSAEYDRFSNWNSSGQTTGLPQSAATLSAWHVAQVPRRRVAHERCRNPVFSSATSHVVHLTVVFRSASG